MLQLPRKKLVSFVLRLFIAYLWRTHLNIFISLSSDDDFIIVRLSKCHIVVLLIGDYTSLIFPSTFSESNTRRMKHDDEAHNIKTVRRIQETFCIIILHQTVHNEVNHGRFEGWILWEWKTIWTSMSAMLCWQTQVSDKTSCNKTHNIVKLSIVQKAHLSRWISQASI